MKAKKNGNVVFEEDDIEKEAKRLAANYAKIEPRLKRVYWLADKNNREIRLIEVIDDACGDPDEKEIFIVSFIHEINHRGKVNLRIGIIVPEQERKIKLPAKWHWDNALEIYHRRRAAKLPRVRKVL